MIITCPACSARYNLTVQQLGPNGRKLKCASCQHTWHQNPVAEKAPEQPAAPQQQNAPNPQPKPRPKPEKKPPLAPEATSALSSIEAQIAADHAVHRRKMRIIYTSVFAIIFAVLGALGYMFRDQVMMAKDMVVALATGQKIEKPVDPTAGLVFGQVGRELKEDGENISMVFSGSVTNTSKVIKQVPDIRVALLNEKGVEIDYWPAQATKSKLLAGETANWVCRFFNPPMDQISEFQVSFVRMTSSPVPGRQVQ